MSCTHSGTGNYTYTHIVMLLQWQPTQSCIEISIRFLFYVLRIISLTRLPSALVELSEPLQVIRYEHGDFSNAHHDSSPSHSETTCTHTRLAGNTSALTEVSCRCV